MNDCGNFRPLNAGSTVTVDRGCMLQEGGRYRLATWVDDGEYWIIEDMGRHLLLQPKYGGANVTARKA